MKNLNKLPNLLEFQWPWSKDIHHAYSEIYKDILQSGYKHPHNMNHTDVNIHPSQITEDGYYRYVHGNEEEFWYVKEGVSNHKTSFLLSDTRPKVSYPYSNTDLKKITSDAAELIREECKKLCLFYDIHDYNLRLITLKQNEYLSWHKDSINTKAAINYNFGSQATVDFISNSYTYKTALLNIQEYHAVVNNDTQDRITLKITSRDVEYNELYERISS